MPSRSMVVTCNAAAAAAAAASVGAVAARLSRQCRAAVVTADAVVPGRMNMNNTRLDIVNIAGGSCSYSHYGASSGTSNGSISISRSNSRAPWRRHIVRKSSRTNTNYGANTNTNNNSYANCHPYYYCCHNNQPRTTMPIRLLSHQINAPPTPTTTTITTNTTITTVVQYPASTRVQRDDDDDDKDGNIPVGKDEPQHFVGSAKHIASRYGKKAVAFTAATSDDDNDATTRPTTWKHHNNEDLEPTLAEVKKAAAAAAATTTTTAAAAALASEIFYDKVVRHFLPANYPLSVDAGYARFSLFSFAASVAGSASMVLSTQTLLLAVGVVGASSTTTSTAGVMAGAINWVLKDGVGQLGGVLFASRMAETTSRSTFDSNPKAWRMVAAIALDVAALLELLAPLLLVTTTITTTTTTMAISSTLSSSNMILPLACAANVLKNIGFLTASASRAAIHQSLAVTANLADVTAKTGSQSMAAGLLGTAVGVGLSSLLHHDATNFLAGFTGLAVIHQTCNYAALRAVALRHFNRQRLSIVLQHYCVGVMTTATATVAGAHLAILPPNDASDGGGDAVPFDNAEAAAAAVLTPSQVAERERFLPFFAAAYNSDSNTNNCNDKWLSIGSDLATVCPKGPAQLARFFGACPGENYVLVLHNDTTNNTNNGSDDADNGRIVHLVFLDKATGDNVVLGMLHAFLLRLELSEQQQQQKQQCLNSVTRHPAERTIDNNHNADDDDDDTTAIELVHSSYQRAKRAFSQSLLPQLHAAGWNTGTDVTNVESSGAVRLAVVVAAASDRQ